MNIKALRGKNRHVTQKVSRVIFDDQEAGIQFRSHHDANACYALFEFRARLRQIGHSIALTASVPEMVAVCRDFRLSLT